MHHNSLSIQDRLTDHWPTAMSLLQVLPLQKDLKNTPLPWMHFCFQWPELPGYPFQHAQPGLCWVTKVSTSSSLASSVLQNIPTISRSVPCVPFLERSFRLVFWHIGWINSPRSGWTGAWATWSRMWPWSGAGWSLRFFQTKPFYDFQLQHQYVKRT